MRRPRTAMLRAAAVTTATAALAACGISSASTNTPIGTPTGSPVVVGASLSLTGQFAADGEAFDRGYHLWADNVNASGGLLHHPVELKILNDNSQPNTAVNDYNTLINTDHVTLTLGPFSSLITAPVAQATDKLGYALPEGAGEAPSVFSACDNGKAACPNVFAVSTPVEDEMVPFTNYMKTQPFALRKTAAYAMVADPFADPPVQRAEGILAGLGVKTLYDKVIGASGPPENKLLSELTQAADAVAATRAQVVLLGTVNVPSVSAFIKAFIKARYNPNYIICSAGPDQGQAFLDAVGQDNATGIMVPNGWYGGFGNALSHVMVQQYIAQYGGNASDINADVAEAYSAGEVLASAVSATRSTTNSKLIRYMHSPATFNTVQGTVQFDSQGENAKAINQSFIFQWQGQGNFVQILPPPPFAGSVPAKNPKPNWGG